MGSSLGRLIAVARGEAAADLVLANAQIVNTFTDEIEAGNVAIAEGRVAGIGDYSNAEEVIDLDGRYLAPGFIDGHVHIESAMLGPGEYARSVVPRGTVAVVTDLHEVANVAGLRGVREVMRQCRGLPLDFHFTVPSVVPSSSLETNGATVSPADARRAARWPGVVGLGEYMDYQGLLEGRQKSLEMLESYGFGVIDGHAPGLRGKELNSYLAALIGSDHESTEPEEGLEKLRRGAYLMIREGSSEKNLQALLPLVRDGIWHRCMFVTDDLSPLDIKRTGDMDALVRMAIAAGVQPVRAIQMASAIPAQYFRLNGYGAVAPGYWAHFLILSDLAEVTVERVFHAGRLVAEAGRPKFDVPRVAKNWLTRTMHVKPFDRERLSPQLPSDQDVPVVEIVPDQILTRFTWDRPKLVNGALLSDPERDLLKLVVVERHRGTGNVAVGLVRGFGLKRGAIGSSLAHDSHNIVVVGVDDDDIFATVWEIAKSEGGQACVADGRVLAKLDLPLAGLMALDSLEAVCGRLEQLDRAARECGCGVNSPFAILSFLALTVIPELRLTDLGLVDVEAGRLVPFSSDKSAY